MIKELSRVEALELLSRERIARLGCIAQEFPYVVPVNYIFDGESVYVHSLPGRKVDAMRADPRVCLQVDRIESEWNWRSVLVTGLYEEITTAQDRSCQMGRLLAHFPKLTPVESIIAEDAGAPTPIVFRIRIERLTGICEGQ
jgi:nitroimidazol reductase NimA-like FMN-containing flavoprotein (pyridoxamine 5'-phosphate oxidase superfamily)